MLKARIELAAFHQSHAEVASAIAFTDFINWNDAGVIQPGGGFRFATKSSHVRFRRPMTQGDDLQRYDAIETFLPGPVNIALAALTEFLQ
jgi:hypothetical protein